MAKSKKKKKKKNNPNLKIEQKRKEKGGTNNYVRIGALVLAVVIALSLIVSYAIHY